MTHPTTPTWTFLGELPDVMLEGWLKRGANDQASILDALGVRTGWTSAQAGRWMWQVISTELHEMIVWAYQRPATTTHTGFLFFSFRQSIWVPLGYYEIYKWNKECLLSNLPHIALKKELKVEKWKKHIHRQPASQRRRTYMKSERAGLAHTCI